MKPDLAQQLRNNLARRKEQQTTLTPAFAVLSSRAQTLRGTIPIAGAKNAALPMMIASLLTDEPLHLANVPDLTDVRILTQILQQLGTDIQQSEGNLTLRTREIATNHPAPSLIKQMRASFWVLAPLLVRTGRAEVFLPGGDNIGTRAVDIYLDGLKALGAQVETSGGAVVTSAKKLRGAKFHLHFPSVGATHVLLMAAALASGESKLVNCAREPEIVALAALLNKMGAHIEGAGTSEILVQGPGTGGTDGKLNGAAFTVPPDRIEAGTYMIAAALCGGETKITGAPLAHLTILLEKLRQAGVAVKISGEDIVIARPKSQLLAPVDIETAPYPGFPSDLQAQWMALMTQADGKSTIVETLFENRFQHISELRKLGARIEQSGQTAVIEGGAALTAPTLGEDLIATDIRASACLVLAALISDGKSLIRNIFHLERGFEKMEDKFNACGTTIERVSF